MYYITSYSLYGHRYTKATEQLPNLRERKSFNENDIPKLDCIIHDYTQFRIPKTSGGFRTINAPSESLKTAQRHLLITLRDKYKLIESPWAYAYIKNTCTIDALKQHQANNSKWFLKLDIKDFFPSCTTSIVEQNLKLIFPICTWESKSQKIFFDTLKTYCFLNEALPQGAATSPFLSNLTFLPIDYAIFQILNEANGFTKQKYIYTRYADDMLISAKTPFEFKEIETKIASALQNTPFRLKPEKTRYGARAGRNWNLGCMLNKDNNITIGHKKVEQWKRTMMDIIIRYNNNEIITIQERQSLMGTLSYYKSIEPDYFNYLNRHYREKYNTDFEAIITQKI